MWGGIEHEHEWGDEARSNPGTGRFCLCGAWLGSLGLEPTPELYIEHLVDVFREVKRVLRDDGTLWLNLGDSYAGSGKGYGGGSISEHNGHVEKMGGSSGAKLNGPNSGLVPSGYKSKDLLMMPFRVAMALHAEGWYLRSVIPWLKRNSMPESVTDRPATSLEYVFLLAKSSRYFWDADAVRVDSPPGNAQRSTAHYDTAMRYGVNNGGNGGLDELAERMRNGTTGRNRRNSDWFMESWQGLMMDEHNEPLSLVVNPTGFNQAHFATFPSKLVEPMIKASSSEKGQCPECRAPWVRVTDGGRNPYPGSSHDHTADLIGTGAQRHESGTPAGTIMSKRFHERTLPITTGWRPSCAHTDAPPVPQVVLDCFGGAGTVGLVADRLGRDAILCELKSDYADMGADRIIGDNPMFTELDAS